MYVDYGFWATVGEVTRFVLAIAWIAVIAVLAVHLLRYTIRVYEKVRWWK
jgi:hypothetical protein